MPPFTPSRAGGGEDLEVGDLVDVPGSMYGTVKFVGTVQGKKGTFAGVELSEEFATRGKNNGDVDGYDIQTLKLCHGLLTSHIGYRTLTPQFQVPVSFSRSTER